MPATAEVRHLLVESDFRGDFSSEKETVHDYYPVENEVRFVRENLHLPREELEFYLRMSVRGLLGEFVGKLPYKKISWIEREGRFEFTRIPLEDSLRRVAANAGPGTRGEADWIGFDKIQTGLSNGNNRAYLISPPKIASCSFVWIFVKGEKDESELARKVIDEYIICYPERWGTVGESSGLLSEITEEDTIYTHANDFIRNPVIGRSVDPYNDIDRVLRFLGITPEKIAKGKEFEQRVEEELTGWIGEYARLVTAAARFVGDYSEYKRLLGELRFRLNAIYTRAQDIKYELDNPPALPDFSLYSQDVSYDQAMLVYYGQKEAVVDKPSDCLLRQSTVSVAALDVSTALINGNSINQLFEDKLDITSESNKVIKCGNPGCNWVATASEREAIKKREMTRCPRCGWDPCAGGKSVVLAV